MPEPFRFKDNNDYKPDNQIKIINTSGKNEIINNYKKTAKND